MSGLAFLLALGAAAACFALLRRVASLEEALRDVESRIAQFEAPPRVQAETAGPIPSRSAPAEVERPSVAPAAAPPAPDAPSIVEPEPAGTFPAFSLETLIGGRLPIWIGGVALVLAGIFLVRYSIESGLLGPVARTLLAALFGLALVAAGEAARRLDFAAADPRVGQALAGAGVASLYGTLYMAAALYHLVGPLAGFALVLLVTALALLLSFRQGPPTAVMALAGGFAAPLVAGFDAAGIGPLLAYLALFTAALFGLAVHRRWQWLALSACVLGFGWINFLIVMLVDRPGDLAGLGFFTMLLAAGASAALPAAGTRNRWLRIAPMVAGCVELALLAPALHFDALGWSFYLVLAAATIVLAWRDSVYLPGALAAIALLLVLEMLAADVRAGLTPLVALAATLLFATPGHLLARRHVLWGAIALLGTAGPLLVLQLRQPESFAWWQWGALDLVAAAIAFSLAWRNRDDPQHPLLVSATAAAAFLAGLGLCQGLDLDQCGLPLALLCGLLGLWARHVRAPRLYDLPAYPFAAALVAGALPLWALADLAFASVSGERLTYPFLPDLPVLLRSFALPVAIALALLFDPAQFGRVRRATSIAAVTLAILLLYAIAKQPLAIVTLPRFAAWGLVERALLSQACLAAGWVLLRRRQLPRLGRALLLLGLFRIGWFDLLVLDPLVEPQAVGAFPLLNAAVLHLALAAFWLWTLADPRWRPGAALLTLLAALAAVRQASHGTWLTGPIGTAENGGYSAVALALALFWLWRGIASGARDLRVAGLALLTGVTFKVFLIDAAALDGVARILSFLGLGIALIGIGWAYGRFLGGRATAGGRPAADPH